MDALRLCRSVEYRDQTVYAIKWMVDSHLLTLLRNDFRINSIPEYGDFISQPRDRSRLDRIRQNATRALMHREGWD
jgi:hypothetical protein